MPAPLNKKQFDRYRDALTLANRKFDADVRPTVEKLTKYLKGDQWRPTTDASIPRIVSNLIFSDMKVIIPVLALRNPRMFVKPIGATTIVNGTPVQIINNTPVAILDASRAQEALVNWRWRSLGLTKQVRRVLIDALTAPFGIVKLGYELKTEKIDLQDDELIEPNESIRAESPFAVRWSPLDFRMDPEARYSDLSDAGWIAFGWKAPLEDIKRNTRFKNTRELKATVDLKTDFYDSTVSTIDRVRLSNPEDYSRVQLWELWDKRTHKRIVLAEDHDKELEFVDWPTAHANFPAETLFLSEYPDTSYGPPDLAHVLAHQDAYNQINAMMVNHVQRFMRKYIVAPAAFDEKAKSQLLLPIDGLIVEANVPPDQAILPLPEAAIPVDWLQTRINVRDDHDRILGVSDFLRGIAEKVDTATEADIIESNKGVRTSDARALVEDFAARIAKQLLHIDAQTFDTPKMIPIIGQDGALAYGQFVRVISSEQLLADMDVEVEIGSMQPTNQQTRKRDILEVYSMLRDDPLVNQFELRKRLVPAYHDSIPDLERLFLSPEQFQKVGTTLSSSMNPQQPAQPTDQSTGLVPGPTNATV